MRGRNVLLISSVVLLFSLLAVGAYVTAAGYGGLCGLNTPEDWPLCNGNLLPPPDIGSIVEYTHRILASLSGLFLVLTTVAFWKSRNSDRTPRLLVLFALVSILAEIVVGGVVVNSDLSPLIVTIHQAIAMLVFGFTVGAAASSLRRS
jgi:cytochrome c oxidase assembly protein subunit 15